MHVPEDGTAWRQAHDKLLHIPNAPRSANQKHEMPLSTYKDGYRRNKIKNEIRNIKTKTKTEHSMSARVRRGGAGKRGPGRGALRAGPASGLRDAQVWGAGCRTVHTCPVPNLLRVPGRGQDGARLITCLVRSLKNKRNLKTV